MWMEQEAPLRFLLFVFLLLTFVSLKDGADAEEGTFPNTGQGADTTESTTLFSTEEDEETVSNLLQLKDLLKNVRTPKAEVEPTEGITSSVTESTSATDVASTVGVTTAVGITTSRLKITSVAGVTFARNPSVKRKGTADVMKINYHDNVFNYDYDSLRKWGLIAAAVLFILGILILTCGKHGKSRCRGKKRTRNYDVTQA